MTLRQKLIEKLSEGKRFLYFVIDHFIADDCTYRASALAFTTLLALVPLMSVAFSILSSFPVFHNLSEPTQNFIFENFVPATGKIIENYLQLFVMQVTKLSIFGIAMLFVSALLVMYTIERSMNQIWRVSTPRQGISAFLFYWTILSLSPFLLGLSIAASSYFFSIPFVKNYHTPSLLLSYTPSFLSFLGFTFLYVVVPNCSIRLLHGIYGALVASILFESAKISFAFYLTRYNTYELLYGAFATIPLFFLWVYWVWLITLLGAEISYALSVRHQRRPGNSIDGFSQALLWLYQLWLAQLNGKGVTLEALINASTQPFAISTDTMIKQLTDLQLIHRTSNGEFILSRDLTNVSLYELIELLPYKLPVHAESNAQTYSMTQPWHEQIKQVNETLKESLSISIDKLFQNKP
ncbi:MAG: YihY family inner membrane protein [Legionella sp.]